MTTVVPPTGVSADLVAAAVLATPVVAGLHGGRFGEVATYLPGRRVSGVRLEPGSVEVHLSSYYPASVADVGTAVRTALAPLLPSGTTVSVVIEDVEPERLS